MRDYLSHYRQFHLDDLSRMLNGHVDGIPAFFYIAETRNHTLVRVWAGFGGDINTTYGPARVPLLAYAIAIGTSFARDTTMVVKTLLSLGASAGVIPRAFFIPLDRDLPEDGPSDDELTDLGDDNKRWAVPSARARITKALNLRFTHRSVLYQATFLKRFSGANRQVARLHKAEELLGIHYFLIGQTMASSFLIERLLA